MDNDEIHSQSLLPLEKHSFVPTIIYPELARITIDLPHELQLQSNSITSYAIT